MIAKLLAQTKKEQEEAYIEERTLKCKNLDFLTRQSKAIQLENKLKQNNEKAEAEKRIKSKDIEAERKLQNEQR